MWCSAVLLQAGGHTGLGVAGNLNVSLHFEQDFRSGERQQQQQRELVQCLHMQRYRYTCASLVYAGQRMQNTRERPICIS
jgi:ABC-type lipopolysaccharide export system ATPase subunit